MENLEVDWSKVKYFTELKDRKDVIGVNPNLIYKLDSFREHLGKQIVVSPINGAIVAKDGHSKSSKHYIGEAIDIFPKASLHEVLYTLLNFNPFGGIGFYFDTHINNIPTMMMHFDIRPLRSNYKTWWFRTSKKYFYVGMYKSKGEFFKDLTIQKLIT